MSEYPEHDKLRAAEPRRRIVQEFIDHVRDSDTWNLRRRPRALDACLACGNDETAMFDADYADLIGEFFGVDPEALSREKDAMLEQCRREQGIA